MPCKIGWRGCRLGEVQRNGRAARCGATRISSRTEQEKKRKSRQDQPIRHSTDCRSTAELFATINARQVLQPRDLMRRVDRSSLPCLACVPGTALLVIPIDHSELGRRTPAISLLHAHNGESNAYDGYLSHQGSPIRCSLPFARLQRLRTTFPGTPGFR